MTSEALLCRQYEDRLFKSMANEYIYFSNIGKYFGLSHAFLQKIFGEMGSSKLEKKQLKQVFNYLSQNGYYEKFNKEEYDINLIHSTPLYKRLINEKFWQQSTLNRVLDESDFGRGMSYADKKIFCCESLTMLLYAFTSMSLLFCNFRLAEVLTVFPHYIASIFNEVSHNNKDALNPDNKDPNTISDYQTSTAIASILMHVVRDTWIYDYIVGVSAETILSVNNFPKGNESTNEIINDLNSNDVDCLNIIFSSLTQMLSLMLHDKKAMVYFGNLPYHMLNSTQNMPSIIISKFILENFGKMFWHSDERITNLETFTKEVSDEFAVKDGKIVYIGADIYDENHVAFLALEKWIYATNEITKFEEVYNPEPMLSQLRTTDASVYISYVLTNLNSGIVKNNCIIFTVGNVLDNYKNTNYVIEKSLNIPLFSKRFEFVNTVSSLIDSKQLKIVNNIIDYKINTEMAPNKLIRATKGLDLFSKNMVVTNIGYLTFMRYTSNIAEEYQSVYNANLANLSEFISIDAKDLRNSVEELCVDRIEAYTALECNMFLITSEEFRGLHTTLFINAISTNSYRVLIDGISSMAAQLAKNNTQLNQSLEDVRNRLDMYTDKYKKSKSENNKLSKQLSDKTKEHEKAINSLTKVPEVKELNAQIAKLQKEIELLKQEPEKLNQTIAKQKAHIESLKSKQSTQEQYEQRIRKLEEEAARQERLWQSVEEDNTDVELTNEEKYILSHLRLDMTVLECESTKRLQKTIMTNSKFNFIPRCKNESTQINFSQNADIYLLATDVLSHSDARQWQQALKTKTFRCVYSPTNGFQTLCRTILDKYYAMVKQHQINPLEIPADLDTI